MLACKKCDVEIRGKKSVARDGLCAPCYDKKTVLCGMCSKEILAKGSKARDGLCPKCFRRFRRPARVIAGGGIEGNRRRH